MSGVYLRDLPAVTTTAPADRLYIEQGQLGSETARRVPLAELFEGLGQFHVDAFGTAGDGVTNDRAAIQAALDAAAAAGGGKVSFSRRHVITGGDLIIPSNVWLSGTLDPGGWRNGAAWNAVASYLILDPANTIRQRRNSAFSQALIFRQGLAIPTSVRTAKDQIAAFAGTAVTVGDGTTGQSATNGTDTRVSNLVLMGFARGIYNHAASRSYIEFVKGDCTNGLDINGSFDESTFSTLNWHPLLISSYGWAGTTYAISAVANNGSGLFRLTIAAHELITGDLVQIYGATGAPGLNGRWTVNVINSTTVDLQGSSFAAGWTSGGVVDPAVSLRQGVGFRVADADWPKFHNCIEYGHDVGWDFDTGTITGGGATSAQLTNCTTDGFNAWADTTTIAVRIRGNAERVRWHGGIFAAKGISVVSDTTGADSSTFSGVTLSAGDLRCIQNTRGELAFIGCRVPGQVRVETTGGPTLLVGCETQGATYVGADAAARGRILLAANITGTSGEVPLSGTTVALSTVGSDGVERMRLRAESAGPVTIGPRDAVSAGAQINMQRSDGSTAFQISANTAETFLATNGATDTITVGKGSGATGRLNFRLRQYYTTPANGQSLMLMPVLGLNSALTPVDFAGFEVFADTVTSGSEDGSIRLYQRRAGTLIETGRWTLGRWRWSVGNADHLAVTGNPEGVVTANPGSLAQSDNGTLYVKATGTGPTGWVALGAGGGGGIPDSPAGAFVRSTGSWIDADTRYAPLSHGHAIGDVTGLTAALASKSDVGHGHSSATTSAAGFMSAADKTKLDGIEAGAQVNVGTNLTYTASTRLLESSTGGDVTLPLFTDTVAGLVPASGGGTTTFLRADGTFAAPPGGSGSPGGTPGQVQFHGTGGIFDGAGHVTVESGRLRHANYEEHTAAASPAAPSSGFLRTFVRTLGGLPLLHARNANDREHAFAPAPFSGRLLWAQGNGTTLTTMGVGVTQVAAATAASFGTGNLKSTIMPRSIYTTAATAGAANGARFTSFVWRGNGAGRGGFFYAFRFGTAGTILGPPGTQLFIGLTSTAQGTALPGDPSTGLADAVGLGLDAADSNYQLIQRTGTGTATKTNTGVAYAANQVVDLFLYAPPNGTGITARVELRDWAGDTILADDTVLNNTIPAATASLQPRMEIRNGAIASATSLEVIHMVQWTAF